MLLNQQIKELLIQALKKAFPGTKIIPQIDYPADELHGDYASNIALQLTKEAKMPPREVAQKIIDSLPPNEIIEKVEIAGPGFINFFVKSKALLKAANSTLEVGNKANIVIDFSSPNIAKPLGIHHILSTIIGQSLYNIFAHLGYNPIGVNHIGDWGTQYGKLTHAFKKWGNREAVEKDPINELLRLYVKFHEVAEKTPEIEDRGREEFRKLEEGDEENRKLWRWLIDVSMKDINKTYEKLGGIHFDHIQGESFYEGKLDDMLKEGKEKGIFVDGKEGSYIVEYDDENMAPFVVQKKDGTTLYSTRDLAALKYRIENWQPKAILYVVDIAQTLHFKQLFEAAKRFDWYSNDCVHVWFGRMHMKDGKMSTRKGTVIKLDEVIDEAIERALKLIEKKSPSLKNKEELARIIGTGALKYNIISQNRTTDITFDWDRMLSLEGNSAPYLQYSYARAKSILRKQKQKEISPQNQENQEEVQQKTHSLIRLFPKFNEQVILAAQEHKPNIVSNYLYDLAQKFNTFYNCVPVLRAQTDEGLAERLEIVEKTAYILAAGLALLTVEVADEM